MSQEDGPSYPFPEPTGLTKPFWDACQKQELRVASCVGCGHLFMPGAPNCPRCWSDDLDLDLVSGRGEIFSFVVYRRTYHPAIPAPYVVALIQLDEGPRLVSNVVGCDPETLRIGMPVAVCFQAEDGFMLPRFKLRGEPAPQAKKGDSDNG